MCTVPLRTTMDAILDPDEGYQAGGTVKDVQSILGCRVQVPLLKAASTSQQ